MPPERLSDAAKSRLRTVFRGTNLRQVAIAPTQADAALKVLSVELYEDGLIVRYVITEPAEFSRDIRTTHLTVGDDLGNDYVPLGGNAGGTAGGTMHGQREFSPAIAEGATSLTVSSTAGTVHITL